MHEPYRLGLLQQGEGLLLGYVGGSRGALMSGECEADIQGEIAFPAHIILLLPADALVIAE